MSNTVPIAGYVGSVFTTAIATLSAFNTALAGTTNPASALAQAIAAFKTMMNGAQAIAAYRIGLAWETEAANLAELQGLPISLDSTTAAYFNNRISAFNDAFPALLAIVPAASGFINAATANQTGVAAIPDAGFLTFCENFNYETAPTGMEPSTFTSFVEAEMTAWQTVANTVAAFQGNNLTSAYDTAVRMKNVAAQAYGIVNGFTSGFLNGYGASGMSQTEIAGETWNQMATLPAMLADAPLVNGIPSTLDAQEASVARYVLLSAAQQLAVFINSVDTPTASQVNIATLLSGQSLLDVAAQQTGNFENWQQIATLNNLSVPYTGTTTAGVAQPGTQLFIPIPGTQSAASNTPVSYEVNFLGIDIYLGPIGQSMLPWIGDFYLIGGYSNLQYALSRRVLTTQGSLVYHVNYGSRIPPEVGNIQTSRTIGHIAAYGASAMQSDPRVSSVTNVSASLIETGVVQFDATAIPKGMPGSPVSTTVTFPEGYSTSTGSSVYFTASGTTNQNGNSWNVS
ncbi:MAG: hypothetical protein PHZ23_14830 [Acidiphilium sp.]|nr:hypothetical protein [Acidiphilium sp.]